MGPQNLFGRMTISIISRNRNDAPQKQNTMPSKANINWAAWCRADMLLCRQTYVVLRNIFNIKFDLGTRSIRVCVHHAQAPTTQTSSRKMEWVLSGIRKKNGKQLSISLCVPNVSHAKLCRRHIVSLWLDTTTQMTITITPHHNFSVSLSHSRSMSGVGSHFAFHRSVWGERVTSKCEMAQPCVHTIRSEHILTAFLMAIFHRGVTRLGPAVSFLW